MSEIEMLIKDNQFERALKLAFDLNLRRGFVKVMDAMCAYYDHTTENVFFDGDNESLDFLED